MGLVLSTMLMITILVIMKHNTILDCTTPSTVKLIILNPMCMDLLMEINIKSAHPATLPKPTTDKSTTIALDPILILDTIKINMDLLFFSALAFKLIILNPMCMDLLMEINIKSAHPATLPKPTTDKPTTIALDPILILDTIKINMDLLFL
ncbi:hypothetical protein CBL_09912 [Carabus blaptoides fortunei]